MTSSTKTKLTRCRMCRRGLTDPKSISDGIGPECAAKYAWLMASSGLTVEALGLTEEQAVATTVAHWLSVAEKAAIKGCKRDVEIFKAAALRAANAPEKAQIERYGLAAA